MTSTGPRLVIVVAVAAAYFVAGRLGLSFAIVNQSASAVWPPAGIALAALLVYGQGIWPAVTLGAFFVNLTTSDSVPASLAIAVGNTLEGVAAAWAVRRFVGERPFERTADILRFAGLAVLCATLIAATIGTLTLLATGLATRSEGVSIWLTWWLGDAAGIMIFAPLIVLWFSPGRQPWTPARAIEALAIAVTMTATAAVIFGDTAIGTRNLQLQFLTIPLLLWAAFRFGARETATAAAILSAFAVVGTIRGFGPFVRGAPNESLLMLQGFIGVITMVMLSAAAEVSARWRMESAMRAMNEALEDRVTRRTDELTRVRDRLLEAQQVAQIGSWEWDVATNTVWWSDELYRIWGVDRETAVTYELFLLLVHADDRARIDAAVTQAASDGEPFAFDHRIVRPDGGIRVVHGQGRVIRDENGRAARMIGSCHDITERVAAEEQRSRLVRAEAARQEAEAANRSKDQFLATLSHELRTPLNVASGWTHIVRADPSLPTGVRRSIETIFRNLQMLTRLVSDILDISRITAGSLTLDLRNVDLPELVQSAVETVQYQAAQRRVTIETDIALSLPPLTGDAGRLQQVVWNLLSNAVKFAREGGRIMLSVTVDACAIQIVVEDDGPGIAPTFLPHVFERFRQADSSITRENGGLGLGLSIAHHLVHLHGGTITAANRDAGGAIFTVRLPVDAAVESRSQSQVG